MKQIRASIVARSFTPRYESGSLRCSAFARYLPSCGVATSIFCAAPESKNVAGTAAYVDPDWKDPSDWESVVRVPWPQAQPIGKWKRRIPWLATNYRWAARRENLEALYPQFDQYIEEARPDVIFASCTPPETHFLAARAFQKKGIPFVADLRDPWSTISLAPYRHFVDYLLEQKAERSIMEQAAKITVPTERAAELMQSELRLPSEKFVILPNGYVEEELIGHESPREISEDTFLIVHSGELSTEQNFDSKENLSVKQLLGFDYLPLNDNLSTRAPDFFLKAIGQVLQERPELRRKVKIAFTGLHLDRLPPSIRDFPFQECLLLYQRIPCDQAHGLMARANLFLLMVSSYFRNGEEYCPTIPAKTYSYLRCGKPIIAPIISSEMKRLLSEYPNVRVVNPFETVAIHSALNKVLEEWSVNPVATRRVSHHSPNSVSRFDRKAITQKLAATLENVVDSNHL